MPSAEDRLRLFPTLALYGAPALALMALTGPVYALLPVFFVQNMGLDQAAIGAALLVARLWDVASDPVFGVLSDRTRTRFGRRKPWIAAGLPVMLLGMWLLFRPMAETGATEVALWSILLYSGWTMVKLGHDAWGAELSRDYDERTRITAVREAYSLTGVLIAIVVLGLGYADGAGLGLRNAFTLLAAIITIVSLVAVPFALWRVGEPAAPARQRHDWRAGASALWRNDPLRRLVTAYLLNGMAGALPATLFVLFVEFRLEAPEWRGPLILGYFLAAIVSVPLWNWAGQRFGKDRAWRAAMTLSALFFLPVLFLGPGDVVGFAVVSVLTGSCLAGDFLLPPAIQADVVDEDSALGGDGRAGLLFALLGMITKLAYALAVGIAFPVLDWAGFDATPGAANDEVALTTLTLIYAVAPPLLKFGAVFIMRDFPLGRRRQQALVEA